MAGKRKGPDPDEDSQGLRVRSLVSEFGPVGCLLAPVAGLVYWLWRRSRRERERS